MDPTPITAEELFQIIGRLSVENIRLQQQVASLTQQVAALTPKEPPQS